MDTETGLLRVAIRLTQDELNVVKSISARRGEKMADGLRKAVLAYFFAQNDRANVRAGQVRAAKDKANETEPELVYTDAD